MQPWSDVRRNALLLMIVFVACAGSPAAGAQPPTCFAFSLNDGRLAVGGREVPLPAAGLPCTGPKVLSGTVSMCAQGIADKGQCEAYRARQVARLGPKARADSWPVFQVLVDTLKGNASTVPGTSRGTEAAVDGPQGRIAALNGSVVFRWRDPGSLQGPFTVEIRRGGPGGEVVLSVTSESPRIEVPVERLARGESFGAALSAAAGADPSWVRFRLAGEDELRPARAEYARIGKGRPIALPAQHLSFAMWLAANAFKYDAALALQAAGVEGG